MPDYTLVYNKTRHKWFIIGFNAEKNRFCITLWYFLAPFKNHLKFWGTLSFPIVLKVFCRHKSIKYGDIEPECWPSWYGLFCTPHAALLAAAMNQLLSKHLSVTNKATNDITPFMNVPKQIITTTASNIKMILLVLICTGGIKGNGIHYH